MNFFKYEHYCQNASNKFIKTVDFSLSMNILN